MLILECSKRCYGRTDGSVTISLRNFVGEGIKRKITQIKCWMDISSPVNRAGSSLSTSVLSFKLIALIVIGKF
jgi:hypothetical protein